jgi:hypothetical protein
MALPDLKVFGESPFDREVRRFFQLWALDNRGGPIEFRLMKAFGDPIYMTEFSLSFLGGAVDGGVERLQVWKSELESTVRGLLKIIKEDGLLVIPVGTMVGLYEFFRTDVDAKTSGQLSPESAAVLERLQIIHSYQPVFMMLDLLDDRYRTKDFFELLGMAAEDILEALKTSSLAWVNSVLAMTGDAEKQGQAIGRFIGAAVVELIRAFVEPPSLTIAELIGMFGLKDDEIRDLELEAAGAAP